MGSPIEIASKKNRALLAVLALSPDFHATRDRLAGLLWGDRGDAQARDSLRQAVAVLRKELGELEPSILNSRGDLIELRPEAIKIDAMEFLASSGDEGIDALRRTASIYRGELLADLTLREGAFEDWLAGERRKLNEAAI